MTMNILETLVWL